MKYIDFITECENYRYSQDHYNSLKVCNELELMEQYIENQRFIEYGEIPADAYLSEGYLMESVDSEKVDLLVENFGEKLDNFLANLAKKFKALFQKIVAFIKKFILRQKGIDGKVEVIMKKYKSVTFTNDMIEKIVSSFPAEGMYKKSAITFSKVTNKNPVMLKGADDVNKDTLMTLSCILSFILEDQVIVSRTNLSLFNKMTTRTCPISMDDITAIGDCVLKGRADRAKINRACDIYNRAVSEFKRDGIKMTAKVAKLEIQVKKIEKIIANISSGKAADKVHAADLTAKDNKKLNKFYADFSESMANTIKFFNNYISIKTSAVNTLYDLIQKGENKKDND